MVTALPLARPAQAHFDTQLQAVLEHYLRALRERIPAIIELKGSLPANFWSQEEFFLAKTLAGIGAGELARPLVSIIAPRVNELVVMEFKHEISLDMLRYELRIGPLGDSRAERFVAQHTGRTGRNRPFSGFQPPR